MPTTTTGRATDFITFTRTSNATVTDSNGFIEWAGHNLLTNSESFDASGWIKQNLAATPVLANVEVAPNGTTTADKIVENTGTSSHSIATPITTPIAGAIYTLAIYCKPAGRSFVQVQIDMGGVNSRAICNLTTATFGTPTNTAGSATYTATALSNGWVLLTATATMLSATAGYNYFYPCSDATTFSYTGDGTSGLYLWGAHLYRSDLGGMVLNPARGDAYYPTTPRNLLGFTENITVAPWFEDDVTRASNVAIAPNGLQTADSITDTTATSAHLIVQTQAVNAGPKTVSIYAKTNTWNFIQLSFGSAVAGRANFDVTNGVAGSTDHTSSITPVGNGWYRCSVTLTTTAANLEIYVGLITSNTAARLESYAGTGVRSVYLWGAQLSDSASLDAYSPVYGAAVTSAAYYAPRLDFDPVTLAARGLLVEEQRTNLQTYSSAFNDSYWGKYDTNITASAAIAPDGTLSAQLAVPTTANATHRIIGQNISSSAVAYTFSLYVKAAGYSNIKLAEFNGGNGTWFNISTGTVGTSNSGFSGTITPIGNGWYRCTVTWTATAGNQVYGVYLGNSTPETITFAGDGSSGLYLYGFQVEAGSFATSYIPTGAATATRTADVASVSTQAFPYSASVGSIVVGWQAGQNSSTAARVIWMDDTDTGVYDNFVTIRQGGNVSTAGAEGAARVNAGTATTAIATSPAITVGSTYKAGFAFAANDFALSVNGQAPVTNGSGAVPSGLDLMRIGGHRDGTYINGHIRQITYIPRRLSNAELQSRSI